MLQAWLSIDCLALLAVLALGEEVPSQLLASKGWQNRGANNAGCESPQPLTINSRKPGLPGVFFFRGREHRRR
jgi:hypothetical protein